MTVADPEWWLFCLPTMTVDRLDELFSVWSDELSQTRYYDKDRRDRIANLLGAIAQEREKALSEQQANQ